MKNFQVQSQLGNGSFGKVHLAIHTGTGDKVAIKTISKQKLKSKQDFQMVNKQIAVFKCVHHPNIVKLYQIAEDEKSLYLIMEYAQKGDLLTFIKANGTLSELVALTFMKQLAEAVNYLHSQKSIAHRDIKLANILLSSKNHNIKLADFGLSNFYDKSKSLLKTSCGSPCYSAPQILIGAKYNPLTADVWSLGVVLYSMVQGCLPFYDQNVKELYKQVIKGRYCEHEKASKEMRDLIRRVLQTSPEARLTMVDLIHQVKRLIDLQKSNQLKEAPKLTRESFEYVQTMKAETIKKVLILKQYQEAQINEALEYRRANKRARKFNELNTFIQLLERKPFNKLNSFYNGLISETKENQKTPEDLALKRTRSSFTKDTLKGSIVEKKGQNGARFVRKNTFRQKPSITPQIQKNSQSKQEENCLEIAPKHYRKRSELVFSLKEQKKVEINPIVGQIKSGYIRLNLKGKQNAQIEDSKRVQSFTYRSRNSNMSLSFSGKNNQNPRANNRLNLSIDRCLSMATDRTQKISQVRQEKALVPIYKGLFNIMHTFKGQIKSQALLNVEMDLKYAGVEVLGEFKYFLPTTEEGTQHKVQIFKVQNFNFLKYIKIEPFSPQVLYQVKKILNDIQSTV